MKILHSKFDMDKMTPQLAHNIHNQIKSSMEQIDKEYIVISTPTDLTSLDKNDTIITIDSKEYTVEELMKMIKLYERRNGNE